MRTTGPVDSPLDSQPLAGMADATEFSNLLIPVGGAGQTPQENPGGIQFNTGLKLDAAGEMRLLTHCMQRMMEVRLEMGLDETLWPVPGGWMDIRRRNQQTYDKDLRWRVLMGGIFSSSNFTLGTNARHIRYLSARIQDDLLGTAPFMGVFARNPGQESLARQTETYVTQKIEQWSVRERLRDAQKTALVRNEAVVKIKWLNDRSPFYGPKDVFCTADGQPVRTPVKGLYIENGASFLPDPTTAGVKRLEADPSFAASDASPRGTILWIQQDGTQLLLKPQHFDRLEQEWVEKEGIDCRTLDWRSFLCPLAGCKNVHEADINVHMYKETPSRLRQQYGPWAVSDPYFFWWNNLAENQAIEVKGEVREYTTQIVEQFWICETYVRFDADQDGIDEQIMCVIDHDNRRLVWYDYLRNHLKKRPFEVIPGLENVPDRWYGEGVMSAGMHQELMIDSQINRANVKSSRSSSVLFRNKNAVDEWANGQPVIFGSSEAYDLNESCDPEKNPPLFKINVAEDTKDCFTLTETFQQASDALFGAISTKDASASDLNQSKTATGIVNLQQASDVITKATEQDQIPAITAILDQIVDISLEHLDETTILLSKDGSELTMMSKDDIRSLGRDVRLTLTRSRSTQLFTTSQQALALLVGQIPYLQLVKQDPATAKIARPLYINQLRALEVNDADDLCPEVTDQQIAEFQQAKAQQQATPAKESVLTNYKDAPPDIRRQIEAADGFQPSQQPDQNEQPGNTTPASQPADQPARAA